MKKKRTRDVILYCILAAIWGILIMYLFVGCNINTVEEVEIIRCPQIQDTVLLPDWELQQQKR